MAKYPPLTLDCRMPFGKYQGLTLREIGQKSRSYVVWVHEQTSAALSFDPYKVDYHEKPKLQGDDGLLQEYLDKHSNPYNLNPYELKIAVLSTLAIVNKQGEPGLGDWDDTKYVKPDYSSYYGSVY